MLDKEEILKRFKKFLSEYDDMVDKSEVDSSDYAHIRGMMEVYKEVFEIDRFAETYEIRWLIKENKL